MSRAHDRASRWHGSDYLLLTGLLGVPALALAVLISLALPAVVVLIGGLALAVLLPAARTLASTHRKVTGRWTGQEIPELYRPVQHSVADDVETMLRDGATWRDLGWLWMIGLLAPGAALLAWVPWLTPWLARHLAEVSRALLAPPGHGVGAARPRSPHQRHGHHGGDPAPGLGLIGMRERITLLGGTLRAGPLESGGFEVVAELPLSVDQPPIDDHATDEPAVTPPGPPPDPASQTLTVVPDGRVST